MDEHRNDQHPNAPLPPPHVGRWALGALAVAAAILLIQLYPYAFADPRGPFLAVRHGGAGWVLAHVVLFLPLGFTEAYVARRVLGGASLLALLLVTVDGLLLGLICETAQHWLPARTSSLIDLAAGTLGAGLGYELARLRDALRPHR